MSDERIKQQYTRGRAKLVAQLKHSADQLRRFDVVLQRSADEIARLEREPAGPERDRLLLLHRLRRVATTKGAELLALVIELNAPGATPDAAKRARLEPLNAQGLFASLLFSLLDYAPVAERMRTLKTEPSLRAALDKAIAGYDEALATAEAMHGPTPGELAVPDAEAAAAVSRLSGKLYYLKRAIEALGEPLAEEFTFDRGPSDLNLELFKANQLAAAAAVPERKKGITAKLQSLFKPGTKPDPGPGSR